MAKKSYQQLKAELEKTIAWFETSPSDLDEALRKYEKAQECLNELRSYLDEVTLKVRKAKTPKRSS